MSKSRIKKSWWHGVYRIRDAQNRLRYGRGAPLCAQRLYVKPSEITTYLNQRPHRHDTGRVMGGDWDLNVKPLDELEKVIICRRHFVEGLSWYDAGAYDLLARMLAKKKSHDGCRTMDDVKRRYEGVDRVYDHLKSGGRFLTRQELTEGEAFREDRGIYVHVGRDGNLIFGKGGCHRLAIAQILGLSSVPVQVGVVHKEAVKSGHYRQLLDASDSVSQLREH